MTRLFSCIHVPPIQRKARPGRPWAICMVATIPRSWRLPMLSACWPNCCTSKARPTYGGRYVIPLLEHPVGLVVGGNRLDSDKPRRQLEEFGSRHCFPSRASRNKKHWINRKLIRQRYKMENFFCRLQRLASASTRRDKLAAQIVALIQSAVVIDWFSNVC